MSDDVAFPLPRLVEGPCAVCGEEGLKGFIDVELGNVVCTGCIVPVLAADRMLREVPGGGICRPGADLVVENP